MTFKVKERSWIKVKIKDTETDHRELSDAMEKAVNWLASQPIGTEVTITEITVVKRIE